MSRNRISSHVKFSFLSAQLTFGPSAEKINLFEVVTLNCLCLVVNKFIISKGLKIHFFYETNGYDVCNDFHTIFQRSK